MIGFECNKDVPETIEISLIDTISCQQENRNITCNQKKIQVIQPKLFEKLKYYQGLVKIDHIIYRCGKTFENFHNNGFFSELMEIKIANRHPQCLHMNYE